MYELYDNWAASLGREIPAKLTFLHWCKEQVLIYTMGKQILNFSVASLNQMFAI